VISNLKSQISNLKSQISNLKSQISNLKSQISNALAASRHSQVPLRPCQPQFPQASKTACPLECGGRAAKRRRRRFGSRPRFVGCPHSSQSQSGEGAPTKPGLTPHSKGFALPKVRRQFVQASPLVFFQLEHCHFRCGYFRMICAVLLSNHLQHIRVILPDESIALAICVSVKVGWSVTQKFHSQPA